MYAVSAIRSTDVSSSGRANVARAVATQKYLAGGTDLLVQMKLGIRQPALIVDIKHIPELMEFTLGDQGLHLGAAVPGAIVGDHAEVRRIYPGFVEALGLIGSSQVQGRCSAGGNLCNASPAADSVPGADREPGAVQYCRSRWDAHRCRRKISIPAPVKIAWTAWRNTGVH